MIARSTAGTEAIGRNIARKYQNGGIIYLAGELGAGKTTLARALIKELGVEERIKSPTYTLVESYNTKYCPVFHFDLYRIEDAYELEEMGFRDYLEKDALILIEWPEKAKGYLPAADLTVNIRYHGDGREISINE